MKDRSKRTETVGPQFGERRKGQAECDSVLSAKSDGNDIELNGETDDEDVEEVETGFDDGSAQVRNIRDSGQPTAHGTPRAHDHTSSMQIMVQVLRDGTWCEIAAPEIRCSR